MANLWEKIRKSVLEGASVAAEKTEEYTKLGKVKLDILNTKRKISKAFAELGGIVYEAVKNKKSKEVMGSDEVKEIIETLKNLEAELEGTENKFDNMKKKPETKE